MTLLIAFFLLSIVFSFLCSLWEAALLSITPTWAQIKLQERSPLGRHLANFKNNIDKPLAAILTLNTIAHTVGAIGVGVQASSVWADANPVVTSFMVPAIMTLAILLFSEIVPKTLGATWWKELAGFTVYSLLLVNLALAPLVWLCQLLTRLLKRNTEGSIFSRRDFLVMAEIGAKEGVFEKSESDIITNLIEFESVCAQDIMTPRTVVLAAEETSTVSAFLTEHPDLRFSRVPVYQNNSKDEITGYVLKSELQTAMINNQGSRPLADLRRNLMIIDRSFPMPELFNRLITGREHIALVVDEFGGMAGIVTMEDVIETLLGQEIIDESDKEADMRTRARREWQRRAAARGLVEETWEDDDREGDDREGNSREEADKQATIDETER